MVIFMFMLSISLIRILFRHIYDHYMNHYKIDCMCIYMIYHRLGLYKVLYALAL